MQIRAVVINLAGITNLNMKGKTKRLVVVVVKRRHLANGILRSNLTQVYVATFTEHYSQKKKIVLVFKILRTVYCETDNINLTSLIKILAEKV